jgi:four helix bundle protein
MAKAAIKHFTDLDVWRKSHQLFLDLLGDLELLAQTRSIALLTDRVQQSVGTIGASIAEGWNRGREKNLNSLDVALGEAHKAENWLYKLRDAGILKKELANTRVRQCIDIAKMLGGLIRSIRDRETGSDSRERKPEGREPTGQPMRSGERRTASRERRA